MILTTDIPFIQSVAHYDTLTRSQLTRLHLPDDDGRLTRRRVKAIREPGLLNVTTMQVVNPNVNHGVSGPVYYSSADGVAFLAQELEDDKYLRVNTTTPHHLFLYHFVAVAETHILLDRAAPLAGAKLIEWIGERAFADPKATEPQHRYRLYQVVSEPNAQHRVVCIPDAGFLLDDGHDGRKVFLLEQDRDTTKNAERVANQKAGGFAGMWEKKLHQRLFPAANVEKFTVLVIAPTKKRINALRKAFATKPSSWLYKFASLEDLKETTLLSGKVWYSCAGDEPGSLLREVSS